MISIKHIINYRRSRKGLKYDALERSRCLKIIEGYSVGPQSLQLLKKYWGRLRMVAKAGGYYGSEFKGSISYCLPSAWNRRQ